MAIYAAFRCFYLGVHGEIFFFLQWQIIRVHIAQPDMQTSDFLGYYLDKKLEFVEVAQPQSIAIKHSTIQSRLGHMHQPRDIVSAFPERKTSEKRYIGS